MNPNHSKMRRWGKFHSAASLILLAGIFVTLYTLAAHWNIRYDLTDSQTYSLSPVTLKVLEEIGAEPLTITGFFPAYSGDRETFKELMKFYQPLLHQLDVQLVDPARSPSKARAYRIDAYGTIVIELHGRREKFTGVDEEKITNALLRILRNQRKKIYFLSAHGEASILDEKAKGFSMLFERLQDENYEVLRGELKAMPEDTACLILAGPKTDLEENELALLDAYLRTGGAMLALVDPVDPGTLAQFEKWLSRYGIRLGGDIIVDKLGKALGADFLVPVITQYERHEITEDFSMTCLLPVARSVGASEPLPPGIEVKPLAYSGVSSWAETDLENLQHGEAFLDPSTDLKGPVLIAAAATGKTNEKDHKPWRIVIFGDSDFISNANINIAGNRDFLLSSVAWLAGEKTLVSIRHPKRPDTPLVLQAKDKQMFFWLPVLYIPAAILCAGIWINGLRRKNPEIA
ncbi:MAG: GldG family protein [Candidatus Omnitrophica bacterium]|nr:GldG family protein [Candidatus Omnitrophota bacterium]